MSAEPLKDTPPMFLGVVSVAALVAVLALPVSAPTNVVAFTVFAKVALWSAARVRAVVAALPAVVVWKVNVLLAPVPARMVILLAPPVMLPTEVNDPVTLPVPSNDWPQRVLAFWSAVAVAAFPVVLPEEPETFPVTLPVSGPENAVAVRVPVVASYVSPPSVFGARLPVAESNIAIEDVASVESTTVTVEASVARSIVIL